MNNDSIIKKVKVTLEYENNPVSIEVEPYRQIKYLKKRALKIFYPLNFEIKLYQANKDLTPYEQTTIGDYYKNKNLVHIKVVQIINFNKNGSSLPYRKSDDGDIDVNINPNQNQKLLEEKYMCSCSQDLISYYCRTCNFFICKTCRMGENHKQHQSIHLDLTNLEESVKLYAITLQADINLNLRASKKYYKNFVDNKFVEPSSRKEIIVRKLDEIERRHEAVLQSIPAVDESEIDNVLANFEQQGMTAHSEIEQVLEKIYLNYTKRHKKISFDQTESYFQMINSKEKELDKVSNSVLSYKYNYRAHKKIDDMYKIIEKAIDTVLATEFKELPISGGDNSMLTLDMIQSIKENMESGKGNSKTKKKVDNNILSDSAMNNSFSIPNSFDNKTNNESTVKKTSINAASNRISIEAIDKQESEKVQDNEEAN